MFWTDVRQIPSLSSASQKWFFCFQGLVPSLSSYFYLFCLSVDVLSRRHFRQRSYHFWTCKNMQKLCSSHFLLSKSNFQYFESFHSIFSTVWNKIWCSHSVLSNLPFSKYAKSQMEWNALVLSKTLLSYCMCYGLIPMKKWLSRLYQAVHVGASSSNVILWSVQTLCHCLMYFWYLCERIVQLLCFSVSASGVTDHALDTSGQGW